MALMQLEGTLQTKQKQMLVWHSYNRKRGDVCLCQGRAEVCLVQMEEPAIRSQVNE